MSDVKEENLVEMVSMATETRGALSIFGRGMVAVSPDSGPLNPPLLPCQPLEPPSLWSLHSEASSPSPTLWVVSLQFTVMVISFYWSQLQISSQK